MKSFIIPVTRITNMHSYNWWLHESSYDDNIVLLILITILKILFDINYRDTLISQYTINTGILPNPTVT